MEAPLAPVHIANLLAWVRRSPGRPEKSRRSWSQRDVVAVLFVVLFLGLCVWLPGFARIDNLMTLLRNVSVLGMLGIAMALVVIGRGIDLSLVSLMVVPPGLALQLIHDGWSTGPAFTAAIGLMLAFALLNGWLVAYAEIPALFATLATGLLLAGLGQSVFFPLDIVPWPDALAALTWIGSGSIGGIPTSVLSFLAVAALAALLLGRTRLGMFIRATGDNPAGARLSGVPTRRVLVAKYLLAAVIATFAGFVLAASLNIVNTRAFNSTLIYDVILVVVLGGIGLAGGRGGISHVLAGTLLIGTLLNAMTILDVSYSVQNLVRGAILLASVLVDSILNPRNEETAQQSDI